MSKIEKATATRGRPPTGNARPNVVGVRFSDEEHAEITLAAARANRTISAFIRVAALRSASKK